MAFLRKWKGGYQDLWKAIIRPPREEYDDKDLGSETFNLSIRSFQRSDFELEDQFGNKFKCTHYEPVEDERVQEVLPCVVYLHGNCSSRMEGIPAVKALLPSNITVCAIDFAGCGKSEGEYISLGFWERDQVDILVNYLRENRRVSMIGLWGRSMGAVTALMHGDRDPSIAGLVLDSPFSNLRALATELCKAHTKVPGFVLSGALAMIRRTIQQKAKFDLNALDPLSHVDRCFIPAFFAAADDDDFVLPHHTDKLHEKYAGDKRITRVEGDHNSSRPEEFIDQVRVFFYYTLQCDSLPHLDEAKIKASRKKKKQQMRQAEASEEVLLAREEEELRQAIEASLQVSGEENKSDLANNAGGSQTRAKIEPKKERDADPKQPFGDEFKPEENGSKDVDGGAGRDMAISVPQDDN